jgi:hypothetical protein
LLKRLLRIGQRILWLRLIDKMDNISIIEYWVRECGKEFDIVEDVVLEQFSILDSVGALSIYEIKGRKGVVAWMESPDFKGGKSICEMFMYVKPEYRDNPSNFIRLLKVLEDNAKRLKCGLVVASAFDYKDNKLLQLLNKRGYVVDTVRKGF